MKTKHFLSLLFCCLLATNVLLVSSCSDPCDEVTCLNGGVCNEGDCACANGFSGVNCQTAPDPCADVTCENGGICEEGTCDCPAGYEGTNCETEVRTKFLGTYLMSGDYDCSTGGSTPLSGHPVFVMAGNSILEVSLNVGGAISLTASVSGSTLAVQSQTVNGKTYSGSGTLNANVLSITVSEFNSGNNETCVYTLAGTE